ncbi:Hypothetical protein SRAE_1000106800 [Strongyloides ratti]|uniref:Uncharacterized protein n=1 Tax=Strongyloides ratti TaxID=34506 RepID=A0A090L5P2_STRRB|nr:Hypothetical protein SRAE_1000106800 [Strongyloides ratti]CEF62799.1 Hypothetical protein SRAE_1000106800 [Strongyloides ratti]
MSKDIFTTLLPPNKDNTSFLNISPSPITQSKSLHNSPIPIIDYQNKSLNNITLLNDVQNMLTTSIMEEVNKNELEKNINNNIFETTTSFNNLTNIELFNNISTSMVPQKMSEILGNITSNNNTLDVIPSSNSEMTTFHFNITQNVTDIIGKAIDEVKDDFENMVNSSSSSNSSGTIITSIISTTIRTTRLKHHNNIFEKYPFLVYLILIAIVIIFFLFLGVVISFLISNRRRIIRQERSDKALNEYGNLNGRRSIIKYLFKCCGKRKEDYGNLERQISASNLAPYRRPPLPPIKKRAGDDEDGFEGSYVPDGRQRLRPIQMLDPAVYGTLENDNSTRSTMNQSYKSTTLTTNTSTIGTNQGKRNFYKEREL